MVCCVDGYSRAASRSGETVECNQQRGALALRRARPFTWLTSGPAALVCAAACAGDPASTGNPNGASGAASHAGATDDGGSSGLAGAGNANAGGGAANSSGGSESGKAGVGGSQGGAANGGGSAGGAASGGGSGGVYVVDRDPNAPGILIHVENGCPFELWIRGAGSGAVLEPEAMHLAPGQAQDYTAPDEWPAARITAYGAGPDAQGQLQQELDKVELTLSKKVINYNVTYVDWLGLPVEMLALGSGADCKVVGCYLPVKAVAERCPASLLSGKRCLSAGNYCSEPAHRSEAFCSALDDEIAACAADSQRYPECQGATGSKTPEVYGCSGDFFSQSPKWCAVLNRGILATPDEGDPNKYYQTEPYNAYAKWVHSECPGIYAFPYDDYGKTNQSGFHACTGGRQLNIKFCPAN
jgi:Beta-1,3-glucanase